MTFAIARMILRLAALLVPRAIRSDWREEWAAEMDALEAWGEERPAGMPGPITFAVGALPHAASTWGEGWTMDGILHDLRYSFRVLRRTPVFTAVAALTLALGIGANAAIFTLLNAVILRPPPGIEDPDGLVQVARSYETNPRWDSFSWPAYEVVSAETDGLAGVAGWSDEVFVIGAGDTVERVIGQLVTGRYFELLGVTPRMGRLIDASDDVSPGGHPVVVLSHALWTRRWGADPDVVGRTVQIGSRPYTVIGVAPASFNGTEKVGYSPAFWIPTSMHPGWRGDLPFEQTGWSWMNLFGRLAEGATIESLRASAPAVNRALASLDGVAEDIQVVYGDGIGLDPAERAEAERLAFSLGVIVLLVLLLTCTSVANLFVARSASREAEMGVRAALGAGRPRLLGLVLTESGMLAGAATLLAVPIVAVADRIVPLVVPMNFATTFAPDARVWTFLVLVGLGTGLLFGALPAWTSARSAALRGAGGGRTTEGSGTARLRGALVTLQLGLSLGLVSGAALLGRSVWNARTADPGFRSDGVMAGWVDLSSTGRYGSEDVLPFFEGLLDQAGSEPGFAQFALTSDLPISGGQSRASVQPADRPEADSFEAEMTVVGPGYFEILGIPILQGRGFDPNELETERVVVISQGLAEMFWPGENAVGRELAGGDPWRVIGVVPDLQLRSLRAQGLPAVFYPLGPSTQPSMALMTRGVGGAPVEPAMIRRTVAALDPAIPVSTVLDLGRAVSTSLSETRTIGWLVAMFASLALVLAVVGLYGLVAFGAARRTREFGIRIALGARPDELTRLVLGRGVPVLVIGLVLGGAVTWAVGRAVAGLLFRVPAFDVPTFVTAAAFLIASAAIAAWLPARRAGRVDAAVSLRE